ncbi:MULTISPECIES: hypothetical protein [Brucella/Ochrobactrum group]|jgi:hypothetical protein|uniref:Formate dehydrogenase n=1 Tax=Brucella pseudintermedia TaxID=370111 RepID=A0ABY5UF09_9HYPH|nr:MULTISPECIES: hypothetical protein [Brucella/Ochrobactrum group]KAB2685477.1 hypothetical protein F9K78_01830 [Brucella pseudintermedia]MCO7727079.1 hypothetical protein [Brucella intermedia]NKE76653.1 hypothetical protein [Ochrobactrum sp. MC-1LL]TWH04055.1 formate dehydrogenase F4B subunit [Ochrobactrum sp. J50]UWL61282.1 hypothetical protein NIK97_05890 [Brucella pseudintermedia]
MMDESEAEYMAMVDALLTASRSLSGLGAGIIAALALDIASDSRTFARMLSVAHALVLREISVLGQDHGYVRIRQRDPRTQRTRYELNAAGQRLVREVRSLEG